MKYIPCVLLLWLASWSSYATQDSDLAFQVKQLQKQTATLQTQLSQLQKKPPETKVDTSVVKPPSVNASKKDVTSSGQSSYAQKEASSLALDAHTAVPNFRTNTVSVHSAVDADPESLDFYPTALVANNRVLTYIAGTPVVSSPYLGSRPAFDGGDYIVNISSINRDIRLMQQRRSLDRAYTSMGYPLPNRPIFALSGKVSPIGTIGDSYNASMHGDWNLGSDELDMAVILNNMVEAYMGIAYNAAAPSNGGQRVANSALFLNMGFVNIGDLDQSPFYFTAGQLFIPFGRFSTSMVSATLPMILARTKERPFILGYKSQKDTGLFASIYGYSGDTTLNGNGVGGVNVGYIIDAFHATSELGVSFTSSLDNSGGMQYTDSQPGTFGGFASVDNGSEAVHKIPGIDIHYATSFDRYNITLEWVSSLGRFHVNDLSFKGVGAQPQAVQVEGGITFVSFTRPSSVALSYQGTKDSLALTIPRQRINAVYNISIWKDTVESIEYRRDTDYGLGQYANGAAPDGVTNMNTVGTGASTNTVLVQIGIYF